MADASIVEPLTPKQPVPEVEPAAGPEKAPAGSPAASGLPEALLRIPAVAGLMAGSPPALSAPLEDFAKHRDEAALLKANKDVLEKAGIGFYRSLSGEIGVVFNQLYVHGQDLQAADKAGKLGILAPPFDEVNAAIGKAGPDAHPALSRAAVPAGPAQPSAGSQTPPPAPVQAPQQAPAGRPAGSEVASKLMAQRVLNMRPGSPTSGPDPGAGRLMNQVLTPVV